VKRIRKIKREISYIYTVFKTGLHVWMVYRLKLVVWIVSGLVEPIVWSVLWYAVAQESGDLPMTGAEIMTYYLLIALVSRVTRSWTFDMVRKEIVHGKYTKYLLWPAGITGFRFGSDLANKVITVAALLPVWLLWTVVLARNGLLVFSFENIPLFVLALILAVGIRFYLDMILGHVVLWIERANGLSVVYYSASRLFGGMTVPLVFLPGVLYAVTALLPFRYIYSFPIEIFQGTVDGSQILYGFLIGGAWLLGEILVLQLILKVGLKRYEAAGI
jgi:ABC-2 type transport system permease protein